MWKIRQGGTSVRSNGLVALGLLVCAVMATGCDGTSGVTSHRGLRPVSEFDRDRVDGLRVLFVGNSYTSANNLPAILGALAKSRGQRPLLYTSVVLGGFRLEDHWIQGLEGASRKNINDGSWDIVVLQQGPSALEPTRQAFRENAQQFASEIRSVGAKPAIFMVWPDAKNLGAFDRASESHILVAKETKSMLFPVAEAWRAAWRRDPGMKLYAPDGFHPSAAASYLAALVMYEQLYQQSPLGLPAHLSLEGAGNDISLSEREAELLQQAAKEANAKFAQP